MVHQCMRVCNGGGHAPSAPGVRGNRGRPMRPWMREMSAGLTGRRLMRTKTSLSPGSLVWDSSICSADAKAEDRYR